MIGDRGGVSRVVEDFMGFIRVLRNFKGFSGVLRGFMGGFLGVLIGGLMGFMGVPLTNGEVGGGGFLTISVIKGSVWSCSEDRGGK